MREVLTLLPMLVLLVWAAVVDVRARRIPNWLTGLMAVGGLVQGFMGVSGVGLGTAGLGMVVGFAITFVFFALGGMGAGDVKLFAGIGAWLGPVGVVKVFVIERVVGIVVVIVQAVRTGRLGAVLRGSAMIAANTAVSGDLRCPDVESGLDEKRTRLPYAVPTLIAVVVVVAWRWM